MHCLTEWRSLHGGLERSDLGRWKDAGSLQHEDTMNWWRRNKEEGIRHEGHKHLKWVWKPQFPSCECETVCVFLRLCLSSQGHPIIEVLETWECLSEKCPPASLRADDLFTGKYMYLKFQFPHIVKKWQKVELLLQIKHRTRCLKVWFSWLLLKRTMFTAGGARPAKLSL